MIGSRRGIRLHVRREGLVAGHARKGGFNRAMRLTFFYTCTAARPFQILEVTPLSNFGGSVYLFVRAVHYTTISVVVGALVKCFFVLLKLVPVLSQVVRCVQCLKHSAYRTW